MTNQWHGGKGSKRRPEDRKAYEDNYDKIFGKKDEPRTETLQEKPDSEVDRSTTPD